MVEVYKGVAGPEAHAEFFASDQLAGLAQEDGQNIKRLPDQANSRALLTDFMSVQVDCEGTELDATICRVSHLGI